MEEELSERGLGRLEITVTMFLYMTVKVAQEEREGERERTLRAVGRPLNTAD